MNYTIVVLEEVYEEVNTAALWYQEKKEGLGYRMLDEWETAIETISNNPESFQKQYLQFRHIQLKHFPYILVYEIKKEEIIIFRFINGCASDWAKEWIMEN